MPADESVSANARSRASAASTAPESRPRWRVWAERVGITSGIALLLSLTWWGPPLLSTFDFFRVRRVEFVGVQYGDPAALTALLALDSTSSVWMPLEPLGDSVQTHPMVIAARVTRQLPATLVVTVEERIAVALIPSAEGLTPVDAFGQPLPINPAVAPVDVPVVTTPDSAVFGALERIRSGAPFLWSRLSSARLQGDDDLHLVLGPLEVRTRPDVTIGRLRDILPVEADLARRRLRAVEFDLRYRDQVIARLP